MIEEDLKLAVLCERTASEFCCKCYNSQSIELISQHIVDLLESVKQYRFLELSDYVSIDMLDKLCPSENMDDLLNNIEIALEKFKEPEYNSEYLVNFFLRFSHYLRRYPYPCRQ